MKKMWNVALAMSRATIFMALALALLTGLMGYKLGSLTPGLSQPEIDTHTSTHSVSAIIDDPVNAPYKTAVYMVTRVLDNNFGLRLTGAVVGGLSVVLFFLLARKLLSPLSALASTVLFASSSLLLHSARLATGEVMLLSLLALICVGYLLRFSKRSELAWMLTSVVVGLSLYVPGMAFFIIPAAIWQFRHVRHSFEHLKPTAIAISSALLSVTCAPLIISLIREPSLWRGYLGLPETFQGLSMAGKAVLRALASIGIISPADPVHWLGRQPILDVFALALLFLGFFSLIKHYKLDRPWIILGIFIVSLAWIAATARHTAIIAILPFLYLVVGMGMDKLMGQWLSVFPRNPIARTTGKILLIAAVALAVNFQLQRYFVAWPNNDDTKAVFTASISPAP